MIGYFQYITKYIDIGEILCSDPATIAIKESLANLKQPRQSSSYAVIVGPSLMGKTQTAFSLSHSMNLLYYNLYLGCDLDKSRTGETQTIYEPFRSLSILITKAIDLDMKHRDFSIHRMNAASFRSRAQSFYTLGFIYTYLKMRIIRGENSLKEWLHEVIQYEKAIIPAMTRGEFTRRISQELRLSFDEIVIFIDEFVLDEALSIRAKFIRNLCRAVAIPVIVSGTNATVTNLIGEKEFMSGGTGKGSFSRPWVTVISKLPKSSLQTIGIAVKFGGHRLSDFYDSAGSFDFKRLAIVLVGSCEGYINATATVKKFFDFLLKQSKTCLPGILFFAFKSVIKNIPIVLQTNRSSSNDEELWNLLIQDLVFQIRTRKPALDYWRSLLATAHILTFPSRLREEHERGACSANKVDMNFFYYGKTADCIFNLDIRETDSIDFYRDGCVYEEACHFPAIHDDILLTLSIWTIWYDLIRNNHRRFTLGAIYEKYLNEAANFNVQSVAKVPDAFSLELLAHWGICYSSHICVNGITSGKDAFQEFVINMQVLESSTNLEFNFRSFPVHLSEFLGRIALPYLMQSSDLSTKITSQLSQFVHLGESDRLENKSGWDVNFDIFYGDILQKRKGYVECKLRADSITLATFFPYYLKACKRDYKVSFMVVKNLADSMKGEAALANFRKQEAKVTTIAMSQARRFFKSIKISSSDPKNQNYHALLRHLWLSPGNRINIYTIHLASDNSTFEFGIIKEFLDPQGIFVLIETGFEPPYRSQRS